MRKNALRIGTVVAVLVAIMGVASAVLAAPPVNVLMHHFLGNGECQEQMKPAQVADNIEWFLGPCPPPATEVSTEVATESSTEAPPETALMHHFLGNGECQENTLPIQVADNIEWFLGPCPDETEVPTEVVTPTDEATEPPCEVNCETEPPCEVDCPTETPPATHEAPEAQYSARANFRGQYDANQKFTWTYNGDPLYDKKVQKLIKTFLSGSFEDLYGTIVYTDIPIDGLWDPCLFDIYVDGSDKPIRPATFEVFDGGADLKWGNSGEHSVLVCTRG